MTRRPKELNKNILMAFIPESTCLGIDIEWKRPNNFSSADEENTWLQTSQMEAMEIKLNLECGRLKPRDMPGRIIVEPKQRLIPKIESRRFEKELVEREVALLTERDFVKLFSQLQDCLTLWNPDVCFTVLDKIKKMKLTKLMLLRNPDFVHKMRVLREFDGKEEEFKKDDLILRQKSSEIYDKFKKIFNTDLDSEEKFWNDFCEQVKVFNTLTKDMKKIFRTTLSEENYNRLLDAKKVSTSDSTIEPDKC
ncbi:uncharacterized protein LOC123037396 [Drosophila rhopaloa]|uniref:Lens epithelium-derived growth factor integrase-binding domain-containing protein n=1 Tax=Drosophila rhopaloa TaxID=1041015 RepID=A0ABM5J4D1_DRORH|nr:uncharacterized protein LOC123037396 [Drosophila rhopaloa]